MATQTDNEKPFYIWNYITRITRFDLLRDHILYDLMFRNLEDVVYEFVLNNIGQGYSKVEVVIDIREQIEMKEEVV